MGIMLLFGPWVKMVFVGKQLNIKGWLSCSSRMCYYGVFDGHAGHRAAQFAADHLHKNIVLKFPKG